MLEYGQEGILGAFVKRDEEFIMDWGLDIKSMEFRCGLMDFIQCLDCIRNNLQLEIWCELTMGFASLTIS